MNTNLIFCKECGREWAENDDKIGGYQFCPYCGGKLSRIEPLNETQKPGIMLGNQIQNDTNNSFLSPAGAGIAFICFFLPWMKITCMGQTKYASGADLGGIFWVIFIAAIVIIGSYYIFNVINLTDRLVLWEKFPWPDFMISRITSPWPDRFYSSLKNSLQIIDQAFDLPSGHM